MATRFGLAKSMRYVTRPYDPRHIPDLHATHVAKAPHSRPNSVARLRKKLPTHGWLFFNDKRGFQNDRASNGAPDQTTFLSFVQ